MLSRRDDPFPRDAVRDLLGVVRALYRAEKAATHPSPVKLQRLREAGVHLREALELSLAGEGTCGHRAAWARAEAAVKTVGELVTMLDPLEPVVREARRAVSGAGRPAIRAKKPER